MKLLSWTKVIFNRQCLFLLQTAVYIWKSKEYYKCEKIVMTLQGMKIPWPFLPLAFTREFCLEPQLHWIYLQKCLRSLQLIWIYVIEMKNENEILMKILKWRGAYSTRLTQISFLGVAPWQSHTLWLRSCQY